MIRGSIRGPVVVDLQAIQSLSTRGRGIGRYAVDWARAIERLHPDLVSAYLLNAALAPPSQIDDLIATDKVRYRTQESELSPDARIHHVLSPFDLSLETRQLLAPKTSGLLQTTTVYDLIPALDPDVELADALDRRRYRSRLELVRASAAIHTLTETTKVQLVEMLEIEPDRITVISAAPARRFEPARSRTAAAELARQRLHHETPLWPYVLYPSGSHPRKNNERLIRAFAQLPAELRSQYSLVITGDFDAPTLHHFEHLAVGFGISGRVIAPGVVDDDTLLALYQGAELVCFASLAEGFGLPIAEAAATGTPVIGPDVAPMSDLLDSWARFDPTSVEEIANALSNALTSEVQRARLLGRRPLSSWDDVAHASAESFERLLTTARRRPPRPKARRRLAIVTPLPPAPTGIATYSYRLIEELRNNSDWQIDAFVDGRENSSHAPEEVRVFRAPSLVAIEDLDGPFDNVLYAIGNSHHHLGALAMLRQRKGVVLSHDVRLSNLYRHENGDPGYLLDRYAGVISAMYDNALPSSVGAGGQISSADLSRYGVLMSREVIGYSTRFLVNSHAAAALARLEAGPGLEDRVGVLPFALGGSTADEREFREGASNAPLPTPTTRLWGRSPEGIAPSPLVVHFGIVDPVKAPELLIESFAITKRAVPDAHLAFVGPVSDALVASLTELTFALGMSSSVHFTGSLSAADYHNWLSACDVAVQLRLDFYGESSAAVGTCLEAGLPTIVNDIGWLGELPARAVARVPARPNVEELAATLGELLLSPGRRERLRDEALRLAQERSFAATARALIQLLS